MFDKPTNYKLLQSAIESLANLLDNGWVPKYYMLPLVLWRPLRYNTLADTLANAAMNRKQYINMIDFSLLDTTIDHMFFIQTFFDGGSRKDEGIFSIRFAII